MDDLRYSTFTLKKSDSAPLFASCFPQRAGSGLDTFLLISELMAIGFRQLGVVLLGSGMLLDSVPGN
jgi:hypothetical protein